MSKFCFKNQSSSCAHYISLVAAGTAQLCAHGEGEHAGLAIEMSLKSHQTPVLYSSATGSNADLHLETCPGAVITAIKAHGTARTPLALCPQLGVLPSCWFCWVLPHMLPLTPELSAQLDMFLPSLQASFQQRNSSSLYTEFVMHKKRQTSVKLTFTYNFSRDQCLSAYSQEEAF